jgi:hypothetical protein
MHRVFVPRTGTAHLTIQSHIACQPPLPSVRVAGRQILFLSRSWPRTSSGSSLRSNPATGASKSWSLNNALWRRSRDGRDSCIPEHHLNPASVRQISFKTRHVSTVLTITLYCWWRSVKVPCYDYRMQTS